MEYSLVDVFSRLHSAASIQSTYWNVFAAVSLALLTFLGNEWGKPKPKQLFFLIFGGYLAFATFNCYEVWSWQITINTAISAVDSYATSNGHLIGELYYPLTQNLKVPDVTSVVLVHLFFDFIVLGVIGFAGYASQKANKSIQKTSDAAAD